MTFMLLLLINGAHSARQFLARHARLFRMPHDGRQILRSLLQRHVAQVCSAFLRYKGSAPGHGADLPFFFQVFIRALGRDDAYAQFARQLPD